MVQNPTKRDFREYYIFPGELNAVKYRIEQPEKQHPARLVSRDRKTYVIPKTTID